jgi:ankyrin repeat protein
MAMNRSAPVVILCLATILSLATAGRAGEIHDAALSGDVAAVAALLDADPALASATDDRGNTALHLAAQEGQGEVVRLLLERGADPDVRNGQGIDPMTLAVYTGQDDVGRLLIEAGADPDARTPTGPTLLGLAVALGRAETARMQLDAGADPNRWARGHTPLTFAVARGQEAMIPVLLAAGADIDDPGEGELAPLAKAVGKGSLSMTRTLLEAGAAVDLADARLGRTPLHRAAIAGHTELVAALLAHGASVSARDRAGRTPLAHAAAHGHRSAATLLREAGARPPAGEDLTFPAPLRELERAPGTARVWLSAGRGWTVATAAHLLVFDAEEFAVTRPDEPSRASGWLDPEEIGDERVVAIYTCYHGQPGEPAYIHELADRLREVTYVHNREDPWRGEEGTVYLGPDETATAGGVELLTFQLLDSMPALGYLCRVDGLDIVHAAYRPEDPERWERDLRAVAAATDGIDLALLPVPEPEGDDPGDIADLVRAVEILAPRAVCLTDAGRRGNLYPPVAARLRERGYRGEVHWAEDPGDGFVLE